MANANVFLPLLDPSLDTFETVRTRAPLLFTVVLTIALRVERFSSTRPGVDVDGARLLDEAQRLAADSLFANAHSLQHIQGMLLLAAYSERNWFAISHTLRMAQESGLNGLLPRHGACMPPRAETRQVALATMTALLVHQVELEAATGTARESGSRPVTEGYLREFAQSRFATVHDVRTAATVELTRLRGELHPSACGEGD